MEYVEYEKIPEEVNQKKNPLFPEPDDEQESVLDRQGRPIGDKLFRNGGFLENMEKTANEIVWLLEAISKKIEARPEIYDTNFLDRLLQKKLDQIQNESQTKLRSEFQITDLELTELLKKKIFNPKATVTESPVMRKRFLMPQKFSKIGKKIYSFRGKIMSYVLKQTKRIPSKIIETRMIGKSWKRLKVIGHKTTEASQFLVNKTIPKVVKFFFITTFLGWASMIASQSRVSKSIYDVARLETQVYRPSIDQSMKSLSKLKRSAETKSLPGSVVKHNRILPTKKMKMKLTRPKQASSSSTLRLKRSKNLWRKTSFYTRKKIHVN